jgi:NADPH:quinone reductase-like Zn-dependent oxidoreductase
VFAVQFDRFGSAEVLSVGPAPEPHAGPGQVRIRVMAAGVSPVDVALRAGRSPTAKQLALPHIPGVDAAGIVDEVGADVAGVAVGDELFGAVDVARLGGASAEFAVLTFWVTKPTSMPWDQAGAGGTSIETATRALDLLDILDGSTLLIDGAAGGVGSVAVQLAIARGARVIGTGNPRSQDFIARLGATPIPYGPGLPDRVGPVDRALDAAGGGALAELIAITGAAESVVTIADFGAAQLGVRLSLGELGGQPNGRHGLATAAQLFEEGRFRLPLRKVFPFSRANEAHALAERAPRQGKIALTAA